MDKLKMQTPDLTAKNIEQIAALFPNVITETKGENGNLKKAVDFDLLKQALSKNLLEGDDERYRLDWPGKKASLLKANTPITKTLRPCREESVNFDTTENLYFEGDNFEVLKILQESYLGKVKMIYIDPPYNTGNDFIYKDDFKKSREEYEEELGVEDEEGGKLFRNTDSNGRFHSDWLSMMYERLLVARDLMKDDGLLFISIGPEEISNLSKLLDEVFGEANYRNAIVIKRGAKSVQAQFETWDKLGTAFEYVLLYSKSSTYRFPKMERLLSHSKSGSWNNHWRGTDRPTMRYELFCITPESGQWRWSKERSLVAIENYDDLLKQIKKTTETVTQDEIDEWFNNQNQDIDLLRLSSNGKPEHFIPPTDSTLLNDVWFHVPSGGSSVIKQLLGYKAFDNPKPIDLIRQICDFFPKDALICDFFSGSATTAHAAMQLNAEDGGNRKFIMVQLPEKNDENSEAYKAGYKTIAEIGKERIRRAGKAILSELKSKNQQLKLGEEPVDASKLDIGFRVYKTDSTNMKDVFYHPSELKQSSLDDLLSNIKEDRTPEDLLTQVILDLGLELSLPIETKKILDNTVYILQTNALVACFDNNIDFKIVDTIADMKPFKVVFKDASFKNDKDRINVEERFKRLSPETKVTVI